MSNVQMPESVMRNYAEGSMCTATEWSDGTLDLPDGDHDLITTAQAEAYAAAKLREALEAAAATVENHSKEGRSWVPDSLCRWATLKVVDSRTPARHTALTTPGKQRGLSRSGRAGTN